MIRILFVLIFFTLFSTGCTPELKKTLPKITEKIQPQQTLKQKIVKKNPPLNTIKKQNLILFQKMRMKWIIGIQYLMKN